MIPFGCPFFFLFTVKRATIIKSIITFLSDEHFIKQLATYLDKDMLTQAAGAKAIGKATGDVIRHVFLPCTGKTTTPSERMLDLKSDRFDRAMQMSSRVMIAIPPASTNSPHSAGDIVYGVRYGTAWYVSVSFIRLDNSSML